MRWKASFIDCGNASMALVRFALWPKIGQKPAYMAATAVIATAQPMKPRRLSRRCLTNTVMRARPPRLFRTSRRR